MAPFFVRQIDGTKRTFGGYIPTEESELDHRYDDPSEPTNKDAADPFKPTDKTAVDLRLFMTDVEDHGETNSCCSNAVASVYEYLTKRYEKYDCYDTSRLYIYYNSREIRDGLPVADQGSTIKDNIRALKKKGAIPEEKWPFERKFINTKPYPHLYLLGANFDIQQYQRVPTDLDRWRTALATGHPIIFACAIFESFGHVYGNWIERTPTAADAQSQEYGLHAMLCVGYSDSREYFIVRNSWGPESGSKGYHLIPYDYLMDERYNKNDSWIIRRPDELPPPDECFPRGDESFPDHFPGVLGALTREEEFDMVKRMGPEPLEVRLALLFLRAAKADKDFADKEREATVKCLMPVIEHFGSQVNVHILIDNTAPRVDEEKLIESSLDIFKQVFKKRDLEVIVHQLRHIVKSDGETHPGEQAFVDRVVERWEVKLDV